MQEKRTPPRTARSIQREREKRRLTSNLQHGWLGKGEGGARRGAAPSSPIDRPKITLKLKTKNAKEAAISRKKIGIRSLRRKERSGLQ